MAQTTTQRVTVSDPQVNGALNVIQNNLAQLQAQVVQTVGPGPGTYTVGASLTVGGKQGTITLDAQGRVTAIQQAT